MRFQPMLDHIANLLEAFDLCMLFGILFISSRFVERMETLALTDQTLAVFLCVLVGFVIGALVFVVMYLCTVLMNRRHTDKREHRKINNMLLL